MATQAFHIISHYTPPEKSKTGDETLSADEIDDADDLIQEHIWQTGTLYKNKLAPDDAYVSYRAAHPPRFVSAVLSPDDHSGNAGVIQSRPTEPAKASGPELASWYKSLRPPGGLSADPQITSQPSSASGSTLQFQPRTPVSVPSTSLKRDKAKRLAEDWFIRRALASDRSSLQSFTLSAAPPPSASMTDILSRAPPPLPSEARFAPPLKTKLGPANKGYTILEKGGWKEGEGLGAWRKSHLQPSHPVVRSEITLKVEVVDDIVQAASSSAPSLLQRRISPNPTPFSECLHDVIDLTLSDDDEPIVISDDDVDQLEDTEADPDLGPYPPPSSSSANRVLVPSDHDPNRIILLKPIETFLKPDRLGIGASYPSQRLTSTSSTRPQALRPKPKPKPFTDTSQALLAPSVREARHRHREEMHQNLMKELKGGKRGSKGFAHVRSEEEKRRQDLLAYMNS